MIIKRVRFIQRPRLYFSVLLLIGLVFYVTIFLNAGFWLVTEDETVHADAIVILMGSISDRVLQAADLYNQHMANKIIFMEVDVDAYKELEQKGYHIISTTENVHDALITLCIPSDSILILPGNVLSTQEEAIIIRKFLETRTDIDTLLIVSSSAHTRRVSMIFNSSLRKSGLPVKVVCIPSAYSRFNARKWWRSKDGIQTVLLEYMKISNFVLFERRKLN